VRPDEPKGRGAKADIGKLRCGSGEARCAVSSLSSRGGRMTFANDTVRFGEYSDYLAFLRHANFRDRLS
jgi:hypothetical protein